MNSKDRVLNFLKALLLALAISGYSCGRQSSREADHSPAKETLSASSREECLNLNTAKLDKLMALPGIGEKIARGIIEHREKYGPFDRPEEVIIIEGISELKYRAIASAVCAE